MGSSTAGTPMRSAICSTGSRWPGLSSAASFAALPQALPSGDGRSRAPSPRSPRQQRGRASWVSSSRSNHGDLRAAEVLELVERVGDDSLGVCFDPANALRVGDDPVEAAALLAPLTRMVHLKDVEPLDGV